MWHFTWAYSEYSTSTVPLSLVLLASQACTIISEFGERSSCSSCVSSFWLVWNTWTNRPCHSWSASSFLFSLYSSDFSRLLPVRTRALSCAWLEILLLRYSSRFCILLFPFSNNVSISSDQEMVCATSSLKTCQILTKRTFMTQQLTVLTQARFALRPFSQPFLVALTLIFTKPSATTTAINGNARLLRVFKSISTHLTNNFRTFQELLQSRYWWWLRHGNFWSSGSICWLPIWIPSRCTGLE